MRQHSAVSDTALGKLSAFHHHSSPPLRPAHQRCARVPPSRLQHSGRSPRRGGLGNGDYCEGSAGAAGRLSRRCRDYRSSRGSLQPAVRKDHHSKKTETTTWLWPCCCVVLQKLPSSYPFIVLLPFTTSNAIATAPDEALPRLVACGALEQLAQVLRAGVAALPQLVQDGAKNSATEPTMAALEHGFHFVRMSW